MKKLLPVILLLLITSCDHDAITYVGFNEPQPANTPSLSEFPTELRGRYENKEQGAIMTIDRLRIVEEDKDEDNKMLKNALDSNYRLERDTLIDLRTGTRTHVAIAGDTILQHRYRTDTMFAISNSNVLKKCKGYYILNSGYNDSTWSVYSLGLSRGKLVMGAIETDSAFEQLARITPDPNDTGVHIQKPTRRQFRRFVRKDGFKEDRIFWRTDAR